MKVNCVALAPDIITSELFGHEVGAFTGASKRRHGRFEVAQDGSINHFIGRFSRRMDKEITRVNRRTMELLISYHWPGNVRELENIIERAMIVSPGDTLEMDATWLSDAKTESDISEGKLIPLAEVERQAILNARQRCGGKIYGADGTAAKLGLKPTTLYGKMRKHRIEKQQTIFG